MTILLRKVIAIVAMSGLTVSAYIFIASFVGLTLDKLGAKWFLLHFGIFALGIPLGVVERWSKGVNPFRGKPRWVFRSTQILFLVFVAIFFLFLALVVSPARRVDSAAPR